MISGLKLVLVYALVIPIFSSIGYFLISSLIVIFLRGRRSLTRIAINGVTLVALLGVIAGTIYLPNNFILSEQFARDLRELDPRLRWVLNTQTILVSSSILWTIRREWILKGQRG